MRNERVIGCAVLFLSGAAAAQGKRTVTPEPVFTVEAKLALKGEAEATVVVRDWIIHNDSRVERLPEEGMLVVELRSGTRVTVVIDGKREEHYASETWLVPAGKAMGIETGRDSVILHTLALRRAATPPRIR